MPHKEFDLKYWQEKLAGQSYDQFYHWDSVVGPRDVCQIEYLREKAQTQYPLGEPAPADLFVFALGEPEDRSVTKIGGVPYRPADLSWPRYNDNLYLDDEDEDIELWGRLSKYVQLNLENDLRQAGTDESWDDPDVMAYIEDEYGSKEAYLDEEFPKLRFMAQFNFSDSKDIVGELPGDVLLLFGREPSESRYIDYYEWHSLGLTNLVEPQDVPTEGYCDSSEQVVCYGERYRTCDYPDVNDLENTEEWTFCRSPFRLKTTRIGGVPYRPQDNADPNMPGKLLCVLDGFQVLSRHPWPMLNLEDSGEYKGEHSYIDCSGSLYIYIAEDGSLTWYDECT